MAHHPGRPVILPVTGIAPIPIYAQSNIDSINKLAWGENVGRIKPDDTTHFVSVDADTTPVDCDMNHDGLPDGLDIQRFADFVLANALPNWMDVCSGDLESPPDGTIGLDDLAGFVDCILTQS